MQFENIPIPEAYKESPDFRFFIEWFSTCLTKVKYDTDNLVDLLDPERCPTNLLWLLCDTVGFKYDDRVSVAYNRLVLLYFMSMIYNRGSKTGVTLGAEVNLAQFNINQYAQETPELSERLEDTSIPVNSAYVTEHTDAGYIDIVYFSEKEPIDTCIEYVRPLGMYCFQHAGVRVDARSKVSVDARLTNSTNIGLSIGPTHVGHYRRADYASMQQLVTDSGDPYVAPRHPVYYRNSDSEGTTDPNINPGLRTLYSMQISNNEHIVKALMPSVDPIFSLGKGPQEVGVEYPDSYLKEPDEPEFNLRYDKDLEESISQDLYTIDGGTVIKPEPAVNPPMATIGDAISLNTQNTSYTEVDASGNIHVVPK